MGMFSLFFDSVSLQAHVFNRQVRSPAALVQVFPSVFPLASCSRLFSIAAINLFSIVKIWEGMWWGRKWKVKDVGTSIQFQLSLKA